MKRFYVGKRYRFNGKPAVYRGHGWFDSIVDGAKWLYD